MIYAHVDWKDEIPGQTGYFLELLKVRKDAFGGVTPENVVSFRYMVAGNMFLRSEKRLADKQQNWTASYMPDADRAHQMLAEHVAIDCNPDVAAGATCSVIEVCQLTVGLDMTDLLAIESKAPKGCHARHRVMHWMRNHIGLPAIKDDREVELVTA